MAIVVSVPSDELLEAVSGLPGITPVRWTLEGPPPRPDLDLVVPPYMSKAAGLGPLNQVAPCAVQSQSIGYDGVAEALPGGFTYCNAAGVHEASTAELTLGLIIAAQRDLARFVRSAERGEWAGGTTRALADSTVMVIGQGGVGRAIMARLAPFEITLVRVASTRRTDAGGVVHGIADLPGLLPEVDVVVLAVPLTPATTKLVDAGFLAALKDGSLLVNVARGAVVDTDALVAEVSRKRLRAALDVTDPEPLPADHPLWSLDDVVITPHIGGNSAAMAPRVAALVRSQAEALRDGKPLRNVVIQP
ncbi:2-hydroxyacid dehydrogenase [Kineosporia succinea]|uniref:Phosphoglycerate dehydrogenase-like enzyme n=1 Tax=Kineosporia succinea TaxID=84632 RepID=A0ABT9NY05_9ACTN|nr:2-hydroxyacid dehydrogenase [Kineosporia succinea]MDP9825312.1 phosphoglycerate dehydrogenase-like enzyme [Kineosporia succinea]